MVFAQVGAGVLAAVTVSWLSLPAPGNAELAPGARADGPVAQLTSERDTYHVGEPLRLKLVVRNHGTEAVKGFFAYGGGSPEVYHGVKGSRLMKFALASKLDELRRGAINVARMPVVLEPDAEFESHIFLLLDGQTGRLALDAAGEFEFQVVIRPFPTDPAVVLSSNRVEVAVKPVPAGESEAFADYLANNVAAITRSAARLAEGGDVAPILKAAAFVSRHPRSIYAGHVREMLVPTLDNRIRRGLATAEERRIHESLTQADPVER